VRDLACFVAVGLIGCVADPAESFVYPWDDGRRVLCSDPIDDLAKPPYDGRIVEDVFRIAAAHGAVATLHAHVPGMTISIAWLDEVLGRAEANGLAFVTYAELGTGPPRAGFALALDDASIDAWYDIRDLLARHGARVTFFVTEWTTVWTDPGKARLRELAALGHDVEPHSVNHVHARDYVRDHGIDAYIADEVVPSIEDMRRAGYPPMAYAFPYGETAPEITEAVLQQIGRVRVGPGSCPY
jgi:peptidoglycan/xylan/chitin deacetylase (PgdA/CDA1 family)